MSQPRWASEIVCIAGHIPLALAVAFSWAMACMTLLARGGDQIYEQIYMIEACVTIVLLVVWASLGRPQSPVSLRIRIILAVSWYFVLVLCVAIPFGHSALVAP